MTIPRSILLLIASASFICAQDQPLLDVQASRTGVARDMAAKHVDLLVEERQAKFAETAIDILGGRAITVLYDDKHELFKNGPFTWVVKCKFRDPAAASNAPIIAGRWDVGGSAKKMRDYRVAALGLVPNSGFLQFLISPDGSAAACIGPRTKPVPAEQWIQVVVRYQPGSYMGIAVYDEKGEPIQTEAVREIKFDRFFEGEVDFVIGAGDAVGMQLSRFRAWDKALAPEQIQKAVSEK